MLTTAKAVASVAAKTNDKKRKITDISGGFEAVGPAVKIRKIDTFFKKT